MNWPWRERTLTRRLVLTLLAAVAAVAVLLTAFNVWDVKRQVEQNGVQPTAQVMLRLLDSIPDPQQARQVLAGFVQQLNQERHNLPLALAPLQVRLWDASGQLVLEPEATPALGTAGSAHAELRNARWRLSLDEPLPDDLALARWQFSELLVQLLIALPLLALPLWLVVRRGLQPLRRFTAGMAALDPRGPLQPIAQDLRYAELQPVARAFDALIGRLNERMQLERAFVQDAAHELRTPLAALAAQTHLLIEAGEPAQQRANADRLLATLRRTAQLSQQLLDLATLERGDAVSELLDLAELAAELLAQAHPQARAKGLQLSLEGPETLPWQGERLALVHVLQNLLDNALRYTPAGGQVEVRLTAAPLTLSVRDDGPGIPEAERARVFDRFWRSPTQELPGTGLGLAIAAQAARRLGGELRICEGLSGRGVGFELSLPTLDPTFGVP